MKVIERFTIRQGLRWFYTITALLLLQGCAGWNWSHWPWTPEKEGDKGRVIEWEDVEPKPFPVLKGIGYAPLEGQPGVSHAQRVLMAMRVSKIDAYRDLLEQVYGSEIESGTTVESWVGQSDVINVKVKGVIRGAKVTKSYQVGDHYVVEMELDFADVWKLYRQSNPRRKFKGVRYF